MDPTKDPRYDTNLNPSAVIHKQSVTTWVLLVAVGVLLMVLFGFLMYYRFQTPSRRSPDAPRASLTMQTTIGPPDRVADRVLPLRADRHHHVEVPASFRLAKN